MKHTLRKGLSSFSLLTLAVAAGAQTTGPSSSKSPYLIGKQPGVQVKSILTAGDLINGYKMAGTPDGIGVWDNGDSTFTMLVNHEFGNTAGAVRAHGSTGAFVSKWIINKNTLEVLGGQDLMQRLHLYNKTTGAYTAYSVANPAPTAALARFCSGDLAPVSAYYNSATGKGTQARIFMNGEESGAEGRVIAHIASGPNAGSSYELPHLGRASWENQVANPRMSDTTIVIGMDDATPGQVYVYVGVKQNTGNEINRAGLVGGKLYGVTVNGMLTETNANFAAPNTPFSMTLIDTAHKISGGRIDTVSNMLGVTRFLRPEDGAWDPSNPNDFYFATTNAFNDSVAFGNPKNPSRLWRLRFSNIGNPAAGGTITAVLDGTEGQTMLDNLTIDHTGHVVLVEDVGNNTHVGKIWQYTIATDSLKWVGTHDSTRFFTGGSQFLTTDEEASGPIDAQEVLGAGWFLIDDQAHYTSGVPSDVVEGGQLLALYLPDAAASNPEITLTGNTQSIPNNATNPSTANNTDFGTTAVNTAITKTFTLSNTGMGALKISALSMSGTNASEFKLLNAPTLPLTLAAGASQTLTVEFRPTATGLRNAMIAMTSNDFDESNYAVALRGVGLNATGIAGLPEGAAAKLFPNPTGDNAFVELSLAGSERIAVTVLDLQGRTVLNAADSQFAAGDHKITLTTGNLPSGTYLVQLTAGNTITRTKLVVAH